MAIFDRKKISTSNMEEDYAKVKWPSAELGYVSAFIWMLRQGTDSRLLIHFFNPLPSFFPVLSFTSSWPSLVFFKFIF
jgi:hypothetical protein